MKIKTVKVPYHVVARPLSSSAAPESSQPLSGERVVEFRLGKVALMELTHSFEPTLESHAPVEEHDENKRTDPPHAAGQVLDHQSTLGDWAAMGAATGTW